MLIKPKLPIIIFAIIAVGLLTWGFFVFRDRNASPAPEAKEEQLKNQQQSEESPEEKIADENTASQDSSDDSQDTSSDDEEEKEDSPVEKTNLLEISRNDCNNGCKKYDDNKEEFKYCQEFCGIASKDDDEKDDDCEDLSGLEKDYCLKNKAINEKDLKICEEIEDSGIMKACRNSITESIFDSQQEQP